jgi:hypothetical protein
MMATPGGGRRPDGQILSEPLPFADVQSRPLSERAGLSDLRKVLPRPDPLLYSRVIPSGLCEEAHRRYGPRTPGRLRGVASRRFLDLGTTSSLPGCDVCLRRPAEARRPMVLPGVCAIVPAQPAARASHTSPIGGLITGLTPHAVNEPGPTLVFGQLSQCRAATSSIDGPSSAGPDGRDGSPPLRWRPEVYPPPSDVSLVRPVALRGLRPLARTATPLRPRRLRRTPLRSRRRQRVRPRRYHPRSLRRQRRRRRSLPAS